jgi:hypothetical protein
MKFDLILGAAGLLIIIGSHIWLLNIGMMLADLLVPHSIFNILGGAAIGTAYFLKE